MYILNTVIDSSTIFSNNKQSLFELANNNILAAARTISWFRTIFPKLLNVSFDFSVSIMNT
jgi:hypothetical protein